MIKKLPFAFLLVVFTTAFTGSHAQVSITGPSCVLKVSEYQYNITGNWDSTSTITVCISGGKMAGSADSCYSGIPLPFIRVVWDSTVTEGAVYLNTTNGNDTLKVFTTTGLQGGTIDSVMQVIDYNTTPATIVCSSATGGNCSPSYSYLWQKSTDNITWVDMTGVTGANLVFTGPLVQTAYYRRKVTETVSGTIEYSNGAMVVVKRENQ